jgi:hypothetical protein
MANIDRQKMARAAKCAAAHSNTIITEVVEKDEDEGLSLADRLAAAAAALLLCGASYFFIWFSVLIAMMRYNVSGDATLWVGVWTWRTPVIATAITGVFSFIRPGMAYRYFGKTVGWFERLLAFWTD